MARTCTTAYHGLRWRFLGSRGKETSLCLVPRLIPFIFPMAAIASWRILNCGWKAKPPEPYVLQCECRSHSLKRHLLEGNEDEYEDSDDEDDATVVTRSTRVVKQVLYYVTDSERFQPPRKRPKLVSRTYRLIYLKSTTPEELYSRKVRCGTLRLESWRLCCIELASHKCGKPAFVTVRLLCLQIDREEYGEALALAKAYGLDCDLVYQRQWRKTPVSVASIQDYLVSTLRQCLGLQTVPHEFA